MSRSLALAVAAVSASAAAMALARGRCTRLGSWRGVVHCDDGRQPQPVPNSAAKQRQLASFSSPSFQGTPVAATLLMHQASRPFEEHFRDVLEMSPVFVLPDALPDADSYAKNYAQRQQEQSEKETTVDGSELSSNEFGYVETGAFMGSWATGVEVKVPVFEKLSANEDARLGNAGIRKKPVGALIMKGKCTYGCAVVQLVKLQVLKLDGTCVWEKDF